MSAPRRMSFNAGEISPELQWRSDLARYHNSCLRLENFLVTPYGALRRRTGTRAIRHLGTDVENVRLIPFEFSESVFYVVMVIERDGGVFLDIFDAEGTRKAAVESPFPADSLDLIQYVQSYDVLFLVHPAIPPQRLERVSDVLWNLEAQELRGGPYEDLNVDTERKVNVYVETIIHGRAYSAGDYVCLPRQDSSDTITCAAVATALSTIGARTVVTVEGDLRTTRVYRTLRVQLGGSDPEGEMDELAVGSLVALRESAAGYVWGIYQIAELEGDPDFYVYLHTNFREETVEQYDPDTGTWGTISTDGNLDDFAPWTPSSQAILVLDGLDEDRRAYKVLVDIPAGTAKTLNYSGYDPTAFEPSDSYGGVAYVTAGLNPIFRDGHIGGLWRWMGESEASFSGVFWRYGTTIRYGETLDAVSTLNTTETDVSKLFAAYGKVSLRTEGGTWRGTVKLQESIDGGTTWDTIGTISADGNRNAEIQREIDRSGTLLRVYMEEMGLASGGSNPNQCRWYLEVQGKATVNTRVESLILESGELGKVRCLDPANNFGETFYWSFGRFSELNGYPGAIALHEERIFFAGTAGAPNTVWGSAINDWEEFQEGSLETSPLQFTLASDQSQQIAWIRSQQDLLIGMESGEWALGSRALDKVLSGETVSAKRHSSYGSAHIQAIPLGDVIVNVQRGGLKLRGLVFSFETEGYQSTDLTAMASHINGGGFLGIAAATVPETVLWAFRADGELVSFTFDRTQEVMGWARHQVGDEVLAVAVTPGNPGSDFVWLIVRRGADFYLERLSETDDFFLDWHVEATHASRVETLDVLDGTVPFVVYGDGSLLVEGTHYTVAGQTITLAAGYDFTRVEAGVDFVSLLHTTAIDLGDQTTHGRSSRVNSVDLYVLETYGGEASVDGGNTWQALQLATSAQVSGISDNDVAIAKPLFSGSTEVRLRSGYRDRVDVMVRTALNNPMTLAAIGIDARRYE